MRLRVGENSRLIKCITFNNNNNNKPQPLKSEGMVKSRVHQQPAQSARVFLLLSASEDDVMWDIIVHRDLSQLSPDPHPLTNKQINEETTTPKSSGTRSLSLGWNSKGYSSNIDQR